MFSFFPPLLGTINVSVPGSHYYPNSAIFFTLVITGFEHSLRNNQLNYPDWYVKVLAILLIAFCGKFCSFYELVMPKVPRELNHVESKLNSELYVR